MKMAKGLLIAAVCLAAAPAWAKAQLLLGVLEESQCYDEIVCDYGRDKACLEAKTRKVRVLFARGADGWITLDSSLAAKQYDFSGPTWNIAFDGRNLGTVVTTDPGFDGEYPWTYPRDYLLDLAPGQSLPEILNKGSDFGGWCEAPKHRPLIVVSRPNADDPDGWKPFAPESAYRGRLFAHFKEMQGRAVKCPPGSEYEEYDYTTADIRMMKSYRSRDGRELVSMRLDLGAEDCDYPDLPTNVQIWSLVEGAEIRGIGRELQLVDAGDYDGDGKSELVFWYSGYDQDGYVLYYDDFRRRAQFFWSYH